MHFTATLADDSHDQWMWNGRLDVERLFVKGFQLLVILLHRVHLNLKGIDFQELCALLQVVLAIISLAALMQLLEYLLQLGEVAAVEVEFAQLRVSLEPQAIVFGIP